MCVPLSVHQDEPPATHRRIGRRSPTDVSLSPADLPEVVAEGSHRAIGVDREMDVLLRYEVRCGSLADEGFAERNRFLKSYTGIDLLVCCKRDLILVPKGADTNHILEVSVEANMDAPTAIKCEAEGVVYRSADGDQFPVTRIAGRKADRVCHIKNSGRQRWRRPCAWHQSNEDCRQQREGGEEQSPPGRSGAVRAVLVC